MNARLFFLSICAIAFSIRAVALDKDCVGSMCFSESDSSSSTKKINTFLSRDDIRMSKSHEGLFCFYDRKHATFWMLETFDFHENHAKQASSAYLLNISVSSVPCRTSAWEKPYPWRRLLTKYGIALGANEVDVRTKYGEPDQRISADHKLAQAYAKELISKTTFKEIWIYRGKESALFSTMFIFSESGTVMGYRVGHSRG